MIQVLNEECDNNLMTIGGSKSGQIMDIFFEKRAGDSNRATAHSPHRHILHIGRT